MNILKTTGSIVFLLFLVTLLGLLRCGDGTVFEPPYLITILTLTLGGLLPFVISYVSLRAYLKNPSVTILFLGGGMLAFGLGSATSGILIHATDGINEPVTVHNIGALFSGFLHSVGAFLNITKIAPSFRRGNASAWSAFVYPSVLFLMACVTLLAYFDCIPLFFIQGVGPTPLRQAVLLIGTIFYVQASLFLLASYFRKKTDFLYWYSFALGLISIGLFTIFMQKAVGGPIGWLGRSAQFLGCFVAFLAIAGVWRKAKAVGQSLEEAITELFDEAEAGYQNLIETARDGIITLNEEGRIVLWNPAVEKMLGYTQKEALGSSFWDLLKPSGFPAWKKDSSEVQRAFSETLETFVTKKDLSKIPVEISTSMRSGPSEYFVTFIIRDVTERKKTDEALRQSETRFRRLHQTIRDAVVVVDMTGRIQEANQAYQDMLGYSSEELRELTYVDLTPEKWHVIEAAIVRNQILPQGYSDIYEKEYRRKDGSIFPVELRTFLLRSEDGAPYSMWAIVRDISERKAFESELQALNQNLEVRVQERTAELFKEIQERKQVEQTLAQSEKRLRLITETIQDVFWMSTPGVKEIVYISPAYEKVWGRSSDSLYRSPQSFLEAVHHDDIESLKSIIQNHHSKGIEYSCEYRIIGIHHTVHWIEERGFPVHDEDGKVILMCGVCEDITLRKKMEQLLMVRAEELAAANQDLTRSNKDLEHFAYVASHDLQEPLRTITTALQMFAKRNIGNFDAESDELINYAVKGAAYQIWSPARRKRWNLRSVRVQRSILLFPETGRHDRAKPPFAGSPRGRQSY
jgi:PAS domain S-box-containing protein